MIDTKADSAENRRVDALTNSAPRPVDFSVARTEDLARLRAEWSKSDSVPLLVASPDDAVDHSWPGVGVRTFLDGDHSSGRISVHRIYLAPGEGVPAHFLETTDGFFYVMEGELDFTVGKLTEQAAPGTAAYIPARTTTALNNVGAKQASVFVFYNPAGADRAFAEAHALAERSGSTDPAAYRDILSRYGFNFDRDITLDNDALTNEPSPRLKFEVSSYADFGELRTTWTSRQPIPKLTHGFAEGPRSDVLGAMPGVHPHHEPMVNGDDSAGRAVMFMGEVPPTAGATAHFQPDEEELFLIVEGEMSLTCGTQTQIATAGAFGFAPRGATHAFDNAGDKPCRVITFNSPAGHERGFETMASLQGTLAPEEFMEHVMNHGWRMKDVFPEFA